MPEELPELEVPVLPFGSPKLFGIFVPEEVLDVPDNAPEPAVPEELPEEEDDPASEDV